MIGTSSGGGDTKVSSDSQVSASDSSDAVTDRLRNSRNTSVLVAGSSEGALLDFRFFLGIYTKHL